MKLLLWLEVYYLEVLIKKLQRKLEIIWKKKELDLLKDAYQIQLKQQKIIKEKLHGS